MAVTSTMLQYWQRSSSRRNLTAARMSGAATVMVSSPSAIEWLSSVPLSAPAIISAWLRRASSMAVAARLPLDRSGAADLLLQQQYAVKQRLGGRRTARHVDIDRHDAVATAHHRIGIVVVAAPVGAGAHGDDVARLRHLVVDLAQRRRHLVGQRAGDDHHVGLARG